MASAEDVSADETILRRIPPGPDFKFPLPGGGYRASSFALKGEKQEFPSYSRSSITSPKQLLGQLREQGKEIEGWMVARLRVADVLDAGWVVDPRPVPGDDGHCVIMPGPQQFTGTRWSKLAKLSRILEPAEVEGLEPGGPIE